MKKPSDELDQRERLRQSIIGLGENSARKSYYPELQRQIQQLEHANRALKREIEERRRAEEQKQKLESQLRQAQKLEAIGTLAGGIAHDFNNILSAIIGYTELAKLHVDQQCSSELCPAALDLDGVLKSADRAKMLVRRLLAFSRQQENAAMEVVDLGQLALDTITMLRAMIPSSVTIVHAFATDSTQVLADATQLQQVLMNLGTNGYHAMRETGGTLSFEIHETTLTTSDDYLTQHHLAPGDYLVIRVSDTGQGMDAKTRERIFDPYFTTKAKDGGSGLGLSVVHAIITSHRGHIGVYSEPGRGTTFQIYLPRISEAAQLVRKQARQEIPTGREHVLVVDDEPAIAETLGELLTSLGYQVTVCTSPLTAVDTFATAPHLFALLITDMTMPEMNGGQLIARMRGLSPNLPVILCTGFSELMSAESTAALGHARFLMKPVMRAELARVVRDLLDEEHTGE